MASSLFGKVILKKTVNKNLKTKPLELNAMITSITKDGTVTIAFNKDVYVILNLTAIDTEVLGISTVAGKESDPTDLNITQWNVTSKLLIVHLSCRNGNSKDCNQGLVLNTSQDFIE